MEHWAEAKKIWKNSVPKYGQSGTIEGELLRAIEKLRDSNMRNGNCNWDKGFEILISFIEEHLLDDRVFPPEKIMQIKNNIERLKNFDFPYTKNDLYDDLADCAVKYFFYFGTQIHKKNSKLNR